MVNNGCSILIGKVVIMVQARNTHRTDVSISCYGRDRRSNPPPENPTKCCPTKSLVVPLKLIILLQIHQKIQVAHLSQAVVMPLLFLLIKAHPHSSMKTGYEIMPCSVCSWV